jgi:hypothetical protein
VKIAAIVLTGLAVLFGGSGIVTLTSGIQPAPPREVLDLTVAIAGIGRLLLAGLLLMLAGLALLVEIASWVRALPDRPARGGTPPGSPLQPAPDHPERARWPVEK